MGAGREPRIGGGVGGRALGGGAQKRWLGK